MRRSRCHAALMGAVLALWAFAAVGCGNADDAPDLSTITINPTSVEWAIPLGGLPGEGTVQVFTIVLKDGEERPLNDMDVHLTLSLAPNVATPSIFSTAFLNGDCASAAECIASGQIVASPEITRVTDDNGVVKVKVLVTFDGGYRDKLEVRSGTAFAAADIEVTEE